jgi:hypothetical protein
MVKLELIHISTKGQWQNARWSGSKNRDNKSTWMGVIWNPFPKYEG